MSTADSDDYEGLSEEEIAAIQDDEDDSQDQDQEEDDDNDDDLDGDTSDSEDGDVEDPGHDVDDTGGNDGDGEGAGAEDEDPDSSDSETDKGDSEDNEDKDGIQEGQENKKPEATGDDSDNPDNLSAGHVDLDKLYNDKVSDLDKRLDDGDVDFEEYKKELVSIERERSRAIVREEIAMQQAEQVWEAEQTSFFAENKYIKGNEIVYDAFARKVNQLLGDTAWAKKPGADILVEAKKQIDSAFGFKPGKADKDKKDDEPAKAVAKAKKASASRGGPRTLKDVPASTSNNDSDAFAYLDKLDGQAYERAVAKLSDAELEAYAKR